MPSNAIPLPQPDAYEYLIAGVWRTETHFNGVKAKDHRCLYATEKLHAHAAAVSAAKDERIAALEAAARQAWDALERMRGFYGRPSISDYNNAIECRRAERVHDEAADVIAALRKTLGGGS